MRILAFAFAILLAIAAPAAAERLVDQFGRPAGGRAGPDRAGVRRRPAGLGAGLCVGPRQAHRLAARAECRPSATFLAAPYRDLPEQGRLTGRGDTANLEVVLAAKPDLILDFGSIGDTYVSLADRVQAQTGIPYLLIDGRFADTAAALRLTGRSWACPERAEQLAAYAEATFAAVDAVLAKVPAAQRPRVYLARGPDGLETGLAGSINTEIIERVGGINVAEAGADRQGIAKVQLEQSWPGTRTRSSPGTRTSTARVASDPAWAGVAAVAAKPRLSQPQRCRSAGSTVRRRINRLIGLRWARGQTLSRSGRATDLRREAREFYQPVLSVRP